MDKQTILTSVHQLTAHLTSAKGASPGGLQLLERKLAEQLIANPDFTIAGSSIHPATSPSNDATMLAQHFSHIDDLFEGTSGNTTAPALAFRRETSLHTNLLGNSMADWASGMKPSQTIGPFADKNGLSFWFDFFSAVHLVQVFISGNTSPVLLVPIKGFLFANKAYKIQEGSVWMASNFITQHPAQQGYYTGVKVKGGTLDFSLLPTVTSGQFFSAPNTLVKLHLNLNPNIVVAPSEEAGMDAGAADIHLPESLDFEYTLFNSSIKGSDTHGTVFGCEVNFHFDNAVPQWQPLLQQILIPYTVTTAGNEPGTFTVSQSLSKLNTVSGDAKINKDCGWLLPAAQIEAKQLGNASGTGALCIQVQSGIKSTWKGLKGGAAQLKSPFIVAEPGQISIVDFAAENLYGNQKWKLWNNEDSGHSSQINIRLSESFPFTFISAASGNEIVSYFGNFNAALDRPVATNGNPFSIQSPVALVMIGQTATVFKALLVDTNLWVDKKPDGSTIVNPEGYKKYSIALRNMLFNTTSPYSFFILGTLTGDDQLQQGTAILKFGISQLLPTLPDPYVSSYKPLLRERSALSGEAVQLALMGFIKWTDPNAAHLSFDFAAYDHPFLPPPANLDEGNKININIANEAPVKNFRTAGNTVRSTILPTLSFIKPDVSLLATGPIFKNVTTNNKTADLRELVSTTVASGELQSFISNINQSPAFSHTDTIGATIESAFNAALQVLDASASASIFSRFNATETQTPDADVLASIGNRDFFTLLDVSSNADQMGVSFGNAIRVRQDERGNYNLQSNETSYKSSVAGLPFNILNMDVVTTGTRLRAFTLPQISWEPLLNSALEVEAPAGNEAMVAALRSVLQFISDTVIASLPANPLAGFENAIKTIVSGYVALLNIPMDSITVLPGLMVYDNDGIPTKISSESPFPVPISPLPVTEHFIKQYNDHKDSKSLHASFTLPFALIAKADFFRNKSHGKYSSSPKVSFHSPYFNELRGGLQIKALAAPVSNANKRPSFEGWTFQLGENIKWFMFGIETKGSTLGDTVRTMFNKEFKEGGNKPKVPLEKIEFSGYGASMFSNWLDGDAAIAEVSQAKFDVLLGRTAHEVVQVRSILYPWGVHVVRTITLMRSPNGYIYRSDSGWKAESDGFCDFRYKINFDTGKEIPINTQPYQFHPGAVAGVSNVREIKDYPAGSPFTDKFSLKESGLDIGPHSWTELFSQSGNNLNYVLDVEMQAVVFDADVHIIDVKSGGVKDDIRGDYKVKSRKMLGYVQLSPSSILVPPKVFANLLNFQNGSLGGPVDCIIDIAGNDQHMRLSRVDVNPAKDASGNFIFVTAARGSLILPKDGSWSVVKHVRNTGDVKPVEEGQTVPLIKPDNTVVHFPGDDRFRIANPADVVHPDDVGTDYGVMQSTGTQKLLFNIPQFLPPLSNGNKKQLLSDNTYFADAYKLLNAKGVFPNIANSLTLTNAEKEVDIIGVGAIKMAERTLNLDNPNPSIPSLLPKDYTYVFINEPDVVKIYAEYKNASGGGDLKLGIDSAAKLEGSWKAAMSNITVAVDISKDPTFKKVLWVDGNFNASAGTDAHYGKPQLHFGAALQPIVDVLEILAKLTGNDFDSGMDVGMSNSPDNWEYKFHTSKEIPVIKFPTPEPPNTLIKIEAGLKAGFYFNEVLSISKDFSTNVPACGAYIEFYAKLEIMCFSVSAASIYAVGQANLRISADTKAKLIVSMKFGFGVELVVGYPVIGNAAVLFMAGVDMSLGTNSLDVGAFLLFKGSVEICGGLVTVCIQIEAQGIIHRDLNSSTSGSTCFCTVQVDFSIDVSLLWVIDIDYHDSWSETRQIA